MNNGQPEGQDSNTDYQPQMQSEPPTTKPPTSAPPSSRLKNRNNIIIFSLAVLMAVAVGAMAFLLITQNRIPANSSLNTTQVEKPDVRDAEDEIIKQVQEEIKNPLPLQSFDYDGWKQYPEDEADLYKGVKYPPNGSKNNVFGNINFLFPSHWRYVSGIDMQGISSRPWYLDEPAEGIEPAATLSFSWRSTDNTNGFEDTVVATLNGRRAAGLEPDDRYKHTLKEIGINSHGIMMAIIEYSYKGRARTSEDYIGKGVLGIVDNVRSTSTSNKVSLASSRSSLAADGYFGAKEILSVVSCAGENITDTLVNECTGIIKSYNEPDATFPKQSN